MHRLCAKIEVQDCEGAARQALGARSRPRRDAGAVRPCAQDHAHPTPDRGTSIRNHQGVDGRDPLQAAHPRTLGIRSSPAFSTPSSARFRPARRSTLSSTITPPTSTRPWGNGWRHPRWTFRFTPTSASWLNAVEGFFAILTKRVSNAASSGPSSTSKRRSIGSSKTTTPSLSPSSKSPIPTKSSPPSDEGTKR